MERLKELRKRKSLTQADVARLFGVSRPTYTKWENGEREPGNDTLIKLSEYFCVSIDYLLGKTDNPTPPRDNPKFRTDRLEWLIKSSGKDSLTELSKQAEVDIMTFTNWMTGKEAPPLDKVDRISAFFDVTSDYLMGLTDSPSETTQKKEAPLPSDMDEREALRDALIKAGIIPADRDLTPEEAKVLFGAAKGVFESFDK